MQKLSLTKVNAALTFADIALSSVRAMQLEFFLERFN
jgi:hypothetical protein